MAAETAAAAAARLAELAEDDPLLLPELTRLVDALIALAPRELDTPAAVPAVLDNEPPALIPDVPAEELPPELPPALVFVARESTCVLLPPPPRENEPDGPPRPNPDRLPRNCGAKISENFSAPVVPVRRNVRSMRPLRTGAVRTATEAAASCLAWSARCIQSAAAPATITIPSTTRQNRERCGGATTGVLVGEGCATG